MLCCEKVSGRVVDKNEVEKIEIISHKKDYRTDPISFVKSKECLDASIRKQVKGRKNMVV